MKYSINSIIKNREIYITTFITFFVLAFLTIFTKYWINEYLQLETLQKDLITKESLVIKKGLNFQDSEIINLADTQQVEKILSEYDSVIKKVFYRVEFSGLAKNDEFATNFRGFGIDLKRDESSLNKFIQIEKGQNLSINYKNSIIISQNMANRLKVDINDSLEIFVLNRDNEMIDDEVVNIASLRINGIFKEPFNNRNLLFLPIRLSDFILKTSDLNSIIVDFYLEVDAKRVKEELNQKLQKFGMKIEEIKIVEIEKIQKIEIAIYILILFFATILAFRDVKILIEKRRKNIRALIQYNWGKFQIFRLNFSEVMIFNILAFLLSAFLILLIFSFNFSYPSIFTIFNIEINISPTIFDILIYLSPLFILNSIIQIIWFMFFANFKRD